MKNTYRNCQAEIGIEFQYEDAHDFRSQLEGLVFNLLQFVSDYNLSTEFEDYMTNAPEYWLDDFKVKIFDDSKELDEWLGDEWYNHLAREIYK